jgi:hypothetical protein
MLIDMNGTEVHHWYRSFGDVWPGRVPHVKDPVDDTRIGFWGCHLYPNGDLLAVFQAVGDTPYGYGLVKLDKESNVLWRFADNVHHQLDVGDDGTVYALTQKIIDKDRLPTELLYLPTPCVVDFVVLLDPSTGKEKKRVPILEAFLHSPFAAYLNTLAKIPKSVWPPGVRPADRPEDPKADILHTNSVSVLRPNQAAKFPLFKPGQVLISVRQLNTLAVLDVDSGSIVWAVQGPWHHQHDAQFLDNGHMLLFDNLGSPLGSRLLEYDPVTQAIPWSYAGETSRAFITQQQGLGQRLPNGNTLVVDSVSGTLLELTPAKEVVWPCCFHHDVPFARRYGQDELTFLKGVRLARPQ